MMILEILFFSNNARFQILTSLSCVSEDLDSNKAKTILGNSRADQTCKLHAKQTVLETLAGDNRMFQAMGSHWTEIARALAKKKK